jgi:large subunit ribosomal protein L15
MAQKSRKIRKLRGTRTCGGGSHKKSRGAGNRGGKGMGGTHKGKWTWIIKYDPDHFGRRGFDVPKAVKNTYHSINVGDLDQMAEALLEKKLAVKEKEALSIDVGTLGFQKVLGRGKVTRPLIIKADSFSESAQRKIEEQGGKAVLSG